MTYRLIGTLLHESAAIRNRVGSRIFFENADAGTRGACIIIRVLSGSAVSDHLANEGDAANVTFQVDFYDENPIKAESGYRLIRSRLSGYRGTVEVTNDQGVKEDVEVSTINLMRPGALVNEPRDSSDQWSYRYSADFEVFHSQSVPTHA